MEPELNGFNLFAGFTSLPVDVQQKVVDLHLAGRLKQPSGASSRAVRAVCRSFEALDFLFQQSLTHLHATSTHTAALLPYRPLLQAAHLQTDTPTRYWTAVLTSPALALPHLRDLTVAMPLSETAVSVVAALQGHTQLTALALCFALRPAWFSEEMYEDDPTLGCTIDLSMLPQLR